MAFGGPHIGRARWVGSLVATVALASCGDAPATPSRETPLPPLPAVTTTLAPTTTRVPFYDVQPGDTLDSIAQKLGVLVADLAAVNAIVDPDRIEAGQRLAVPQPPPAPATTSLP
jgi:nucleoid-associated protein YgaU